MPSLFEARRRLPISATNVSLRRAGNPTGARDPRRDGDRNLLPFLTCRAASLARASTRGEPRSVRSLRPRCWFLSVARVCPTAMSTRTRHLSRLAPTKCSDDRRARVCGPSEGRHLLRLREAHRPRARVHAHCLAHADAVPLLGEPQDTLCPRRVRRHGRKPLPTVDHRPRPVFR